MVNRIRTISFAVLALVLAAATSRAAPAAAEVVRYATTPGAEPSKTFTLAVNGEPVLVEKFKDVSYARFALGGAAMVDIKVAEPFSAATVSPLSYRIETSRAGDTLRFRLDGSRKLIVQVEGIAEKLFIFADALERDAPVLGQKNVTSLLDFVSDTSGRTLQTKQLQTAIDTVSQRGGGVLFVPNGRYLTGTFVMRKGVTLYLESGALIQGSDRLDDYNDNGCFSFFNKTGRVMTRRGAMIYFDRADGAQIRGRGVIAMAGTKIKADTGQKIRICNLIDSRDVGIHDVVLRDSGGFNIHILHCTNVTMRGYKIVNDLALPNQDGTDPDGSTNVVVDDVFMYTSDDAIAVKADFRHCENVVVKNCVFWTLKSALKVGSDPYHGARNIVFENNDVVRADRALALYAGKGFIENVKFRDNRSEFVGGDAKRQLIVFQVTNSKETATDKNRRGVGYIRDVEVINYTAYQKSQNPSVIVGTVATDGTVHKVSNVRFENLTIAGQRCLSLADANILTTGKGVPKGVTTIENVRFE